jgi:hypothetical protein
LLQGEFVFDLVVSSNPYPFRLGLVGAALLAQSDRSSLKDPVEALENFYLPELGDEVTILESPKATRLNGQMAATALVSYPGLIEPGTTGMYVTRIATIAGPDRLVYVQAIANEEYATEFSPLSI